MRNQISPSPPRSELGSMMSSEIGTLLLHDLLHDRTRSPPSPPRSEPSLSGLTLSPSDPFVHRGETGRNCNQKMIPIDCSLGDEFLNFNGGDGDNDGREGDEPEPKPPQTTRDPLREEPSVILDGNSDLDQKIRSVLGNLCGGRHGPLLLQFWTKATKIDGLFVLETQSSHSFLVTPNDELCRYWELSRGNKTVLADIPRVCINNLGRCGSASVSLLLSVYLPVRQQGSYEEICVGMLEIVSNTIETCLQFFKESRVYGLFKNEGLICIDIVHEHSRMQLDVSTQGGEVPSNDFVDNSEQFTPKGDLNDKDQFVRASNDCVNNTEQFTPKGHDVSTQGSEVPSNDFVDNTEQFTPEGVLYDQKQFVRWARDVYKNDGVVLVIRSSKDDEVYFRCERHGKSAKTKNGQTSSKKCNCPFQIVGSKKKNGIWSLRKIDGSHNH